MQGSTTTLGILVGGGPAPGINGVISAATIEARNAGWRVLGIMDGFRWLGEGRADMARELEIAHVSRIHFKGGSILRTSRDNPTENPEKMAKVAEAIEALGLDCLLTIGGDGTLFLAHSMAQWMDGKLRVVHVPKTIDNDIPIPGGFSSFGFQTARHYGVSVVKSLMEDAQTSNRWYVVVTMGRQTGHLALGIGKAAGATLIVIPEEFPPGLVPLDLVVDRIEGSVIKRLAMGRLDGVAVVAEGLAERLERADLERLCKESTDRHGRLRFSEIPFSTALRDALRDRMVARGIGTTFVAKDLGYELRCADPIPFDTEYTRDLGHGAVRCLLEGQSGVMITRTEAKITPVPLRTFVDIASSRARVRYVDVHSDGCRVAASYQIRLRPEDLAGEEAAGKLAEAGRTTVEDLRARFGGGTSRGDG